MAQATVLIANVNESARLLHASVVESLGAKAQTVSEGEETFRRARQCDYDLILLDAVLLERMGLEVVQALDIFKAGQKIILLSDDGDEAKVRLMEEHDSIVACLSLSTPVEELRSTVRAVLGQDRATKPEKGRILIIDDDEEFLVLIQDRLEQEGFGILTANSGPAGCELAAQTRPDLVLLDVIMPAPDGLETLRKFKAAPETQNIPVIMLSASKNIEEIFLAKKLGAYSYWLKDRPWVGLLGRIRRLVPDAQVQTVTD